MGRNNFNHLFLIFASFLFFSCNKIISENKNINKPNASSDLTAVTLSEGLVAWYPFNGNTDDASGNGNNVILNKDAVPVAGKNGEPNNAYYFNGASWMRVANSSTIGNLSRITLMTRVKVQGFYDRKCHANRIISKGYNDYWKGRYTLDFSDMLYYNYNGCYEKIKPNYENFGGSFGDGQATASGVIDSDYIKRNTWYTLIYTYDGRYSRLYVDGVLKGIAEITTTFNENTRDLFIGRNEDHQYPYFFTGIIDEIRIYNRALNISEVNNLSGD